jgi:DNA-binding PadR family transcriptional regulator
MGSTVLKKSEHQAQREFLGEFEQIVMLAILRLRDRAYGMTIRQEIVSRAGRDVTVSAVYITLDRLLAKGYVSDFMGEPTTERGGRAKRFFRVEGKGMKALQRSQHAMSKMSAGLELMPEAI